MGDSLEAILAGGIGPLNDCGGKPEKSGRPEHWELLKSWATLEIVFPGKPHGTQKTYASARNYSKVGSTIG
jgi:hypothetical protein